jgi:hypothetical protein
MQTKKMNLADVKSKLGRAEMKFIFGGEDNPGRTGHNCTWYYTNGNQGLTSCGDAPLSTCQNAANAHCQAYPSICATVACS